MRVKTTQDPERYEFERNPDDKCTIIFRADNRETHAIKEGVIRGQDKEGFSPSWEYFKALVMDIEGLVDDETGAAIECEFDEDGSLADSMISMFTFQERIDIANRAYGVVELTEEDTKNSG